jgi:hypothetical protein
MHLVEEDTKKKNSSPMLCASLNPISFDYWSQTFERNWKKKDTHNSTLKFLVSMST